MQAVFVLYLCALSSIFAESKKIIVSGEAITIEVPKGNAELGMSIVGGAETRLVC